jgi:oligoendopeptidase F
LSKELKTREEISEKYKWNLNDIYADDSKFESELESVLAEVKKLKSSKQILQQVQRIY